MENGISVKADLAGCKVVFLVPPLDKCIDELAIKAIQVLLNGGVKVITMTIQEASEKLAKIQQRHNGKIPAGQKFLKLTSTGNVIQLFY